MRANSLKILAVSAAALLAACILPFSRSATSCPLRPVFIAEGTGTLMPYKSEPVRFIDAPGTESPSRSAVSYYGNNVIRNAEAKPSGWPDFHSELLITHPRRLPVLHMDTSDIRIALESTTKGSGVSLVRRISPAYEENTADIYLPRLTIAGTGYAVYPVSSMPYGFTDGTVYSLASEAPADPRILAGLQFILENTPPYKSYCCYPGEYENASRAAAALAVRAYIRWCTSGQDAYDSFDNLEAFDLRSFPPDYFAYLYFLYDGAVTAASGQVSSAASVILLEAKDSPDYPVLVTLGKLSEAVPNEQAPAVDTVLEEPRLSESRAGEDLCRLTVRAVDAFSGKPLPGCDIILRHESEDYASAVTDENGEAVIPDLPAGKYQVVQKNRLKGYLEPSHTYHVHLSGEFPADRVCVMNIPKSGTLQISATDSYTGEPVEGAVFRVLEKKRELCTFLTNKEGIDYSRLPTGKYDVVCDLLPEGYVTLKGPETVSVRRDEKAEANYTLTRKKREPALNRIAYYVVAKSRMQASRLIAEKQLLISAKRLDQFKTAGAVRNSIRSMLYFAKNQGKYGLRLFERENGRYQENAPEKASEGQKSGSPQITAYPVPVQAADQATGDLLSGVYIRILSQDGSSVFFYTDGDDPDIPELIPGEYEARIVLVPEYYAVPDRIIRFSVGEDGTVIGDTEFLLEKLSILVTAEDENGNPLCNVTFDMTETSTGVSCREVTDENGAAVFHPVPFGDYLITEVYPADGYALNPSKILLHVDGATEALPVPVVTLVSSQCSVACGVAGHAGPVRNAEIILRDACGSVLQQAYADSDGLAVLYGIPCGVYTVSVRNPDSGSTEELKESLVVSPESGTAENLLFKVY